MRIIDIAECIDRERLRGEILPKYADAFDPDMFKEETGKFLFYAEGNEFYIKETEDEIHIFAAHSNYVSIELAFVGDLIFFLSCTFPLNELEEEDLEEDLDDEPEEVEPKPQPKEEFEKEEDLTLTHPDLFLTCRN